MEMYHSNNFEGNECSGRGMCSISPKVSSFQEVILTILQHSAHYISKLEEMGYNCAIDKLILATSLSEIISTTDYSDEQFLSIITGCFQDTLKLKRIYNEQCKIKKLPCYDFRIPINIHPEMNLSDILTHGQNIIAKKNIKFSPEQRRLLELLFISIKSTALSIVKLFDYGLTDIQELNILVKSINIFNNKNFSAKKIKDAVNELAKSDINLWLKQSNIQREKFGNISETDVSLSTTHGKAILVSGSSLVDLAALLEAVKEEDIDVYTHGDLLIAHAFDYFKQFDCLKGHYGSVSDNNIVDFATFPGVILLTRHATQNIEYLIRGRLYTTNNIAPKSVIKIDNSNFEELITAAKSAKGFKRGQRRDSIRVGANLSVLSQTFENIINRLNSEKIKKIIIIGLANYSLEQSDYFEKLFKKATKDCYIISFSYYSHCNNLLHINIANNHPILLEILDLFFQNISVLSNKYVYYLAKCDANTISSMIGLIEAGAKNVFISTCAPTILNPSIVNLLVKLYGVNKTTTAEADLNN